MAYDTPEALAKLAEIDPEYAELLATTEQPKLELSYPVVQAIRQQTLAQGLQASAEAIAAGHNEEVRTIPMRDGFESEIRIHRPKKTTPDNSSPLIVSIYGGGFVMGNNMQFAPTARRLTSLFNAIVVCISYRLAPEHPWPQSHHDAWDSLLWLAANATSVGADPSKAGFILHGASAGGNIAAVLAQKSLRDEGKALLGPAKITGVALDVPMIFKDPENVPSEHKPLYLSFEQNKDAPGMLTPQAVEYIRSAVKGDGFSPDFSPVNAANACVGMPPVLIQAAGMDLYRDDALIYDRMLRAKGVETRLKVYPGVPHGHAHMYPSLRLTKEANVDFLEGMGWLLGREVGRDEVEGALLEGALRV